MLVWRSKQFTELFAWLRANAKGPVTVLMEYEGKLSWNPINPERLYR